MNLKRSLVLLTLNLISSFAFAGFTREVGPILSNNHAQEVCPVVCENSNGTFDGNWWTSEFGKKSVCQCAEKGFVQETRVINSNVEAQSVCPVVCKQAGGGFDGNWWQAGPGRSACSCASNIHPLPQDECNRPHFCTLDVDPATCTDTITGQVESGSNACGAIGALKRAACSSGSTSFSSLTVRCVKDRFEF